jgi:hypothetical protein
LEGSIHVIFKLSIGGSVIRVGEFSDRPTIAWPLRPFELFLSATDQAPDLDATITITHDLPAFPHHDLLFDADAGLWRLYATGNGYLLECHDTLSLDRRSVAEMTSDFRTIRVWSKPTELNSVSSWTPMQVFNPILEICLITVLARRGGCVLHSAGAVLDGCGYLFTGPSGSGKSTLSQFFADRGALILSDERLILTHTSSGFCMHGTPWIGSGQFASNASAPVTALYTISHGVDGHRLENPTPARLFSALLQQTFLPLWDRQAMNSTLAFLERCVGDIPCHHLTFSKDSSVVDYVQTMHRNPSLVTT